MFTLIWYCTAWEWKMEMWHNCRIMFWHFPRVLRQRNTGNPGTPAKPLQLTHFPITVIFTVTAVDVFCR